MGLDNGIYMKKKNEKVKLPKKFNFWENEEGNEICYWRKWWNFRNEVVSFLSINEEGEADLSISDLEKILIVLKNINKNTWVDNGWEWRTIKPMVRYSKKALKWAIKQKKKYNDEIEFVFYDSY